MVVLVRSSMEKPIKVCKQPWAAYSSPLLLHCRELLFSGSCWLVRVFCFWICYFWMSWMLPRFLSIC